VNNRPFFFLPQLNYFYMLVDIVLKNAKVFNVEHMQIVKGEKFSLLTDATSPIRWFSDNDPVLSIDVLGANADLSADQLGNSTIFIFDSAIPAPGQAPTLLKNLYIEVVSATDQAAILNTSAGNPVSK
jgi:hypothetical protein